MSLVEAAQSGNLEEVKQLLSLKTQDINQKQDGCTALHLAAFYNRLNVVEYLVYCGAQVNAQNFSGITPLHWSFLFLHLLSLYHLLLLLIPLYIVHHTLLLSFPKRIRA